MLIKFGSYLPTRKEKTSLEATCFVNHYWKMGVWISYEGVCILKMWLQLFQHKFNHYKIPKMALQNDPPCSKLCIQQSVLGHYKMHSHVFNLMWNHGFWLLCDRRWKANWQYTLRGIEKRHSWLRIYKRLRKKKSMTWWNDFGTYGLCGTWCWKNVLHNAAYVWA